jgi:arabinofuranosyltransferase
MGSASRWWQSIRFEILPQVDTTIAVRNALPATRNTTRTWNKVSIGVVVATFAALAWHRRWVCDDGLILLRTVQNILDGNGPVFNAGERVEANTSTLWTYFLTLAGLLPGVHLEWAAVVGGFLFAVAGVFLGMDGARRLHPSKLIAPAGVLVLLALPPFWDFATSGLETGLVTFWIAGVWWLLLRYATRPVAVWGTAVVIGCGPLVRPELALFSAVAFVALLATGKPGWRRALAWTAAAGALPVAYQIFRMGYYGITTPNTALTKEASKARWGMGWQYLVDLFEPYLLLIPFVPLLVVAVLVLRNSARDTAIMTASPIVAAIALGLYVTRVGGDYMHGRMLLPALLCWLLPVLVVPLTRRTALLLAPVAVMAFATAGWLRPAYTVAHQIGPKGISDARVFWLDTTLNPHPILATGAAHVPGYLVELADARAGMSGPVVAVSVVKHTWVVYPAARTVVSSPGALGFPGLFLPRNEKVVDDLGLASPLAAHTDSIPGWPMGHDKLLPASWTVADAALGSPGRLAAAGGGAIPAEDIAAARRALERPEIRELLDSVRAPLTAGRFWSNLVHSVVRSGLRYDRDPYLAQLAG